MSELSINPSRRAAGTMVPPAWLIALLSIVGGCALLPLLLTSTVGLTIGMQVMVLAVFAYSYQLLFGLANLLSFGHAVYFGVGAFLAAHVMNNAHLAASGFVVEAVPVVGLIGGALASVFFGYPTSRTTGTPFAMVTLGIGELVGACLLMFPAVFGGEGGITTDRSALPSLFGGSLGTTRQIYPLVLAWTVVLIGMALWLRQTPLGLLARAIRNNSERVGFLGFDPAAIRFRIIILAGMLAGAAGAMSAMIYEIVSVEAVALSNSANVLIMTVIGGAGSALGPLLGAVMLTFMQTVLSGVTHAWPMYYGLIFVAIILGAPGGLADIFNRPQFRQSKFLMIILLRGSAAVMGIEWLYRVREGAVLPPLQFYGGPLLAFATLIVAYVLAKRQRVSR